MNETLANLKERLKKAIDKKEKAEAEIKRLTAKIEQEEMAAIRYTLKEYNIKPSDLPELLKQISKDGVIVADNYDKA